MLMRLHWLLLRRQGGLNITYLSCGHSYLYVLCLLADISNNFYAVARTVSRAPFLQTHSVELAGSDLHTHTHLTSELTIVHRN